MWKNRLVFGVIFTLILLGPGCGGKHSANYQREGVNLALINQIAILPFANNTNDKFAAARLRELTGTQILAMGLFDMVDNTIVDSKLSEEAVGSADEPIDSATLKRLGQRLNIQAFLLGSVDQYDMVRSGSSQYLELAITFRLVEVNSGTVLYRSSGFRSGENLASRLLGIDSNDPYHVSLKLVTDLLSRLEFEGE